MPPGIPKVISYNIACQWHPCLSQHLLNLPADVRVKLPEDSVCFAIPKYHFAGHKQKNHNQFSFNLKSGSCRTDGEEIEQAWSKNDATAASTREMGPGARQDTLEDHFGSGNWQKTVGLGKSTQTAVSDTLLTLSR